MALVASNILINSEVQKMDSADWAAVFPSEIKEVS